MRAENLADDATAANPRYNVYSSDASVQQVCFSKAYDEPPNPTRRTVR